MARRWMVRGFAEKDALALLLALLSVGVLFGWYADIAFLKSVVPGFTTMKANTAFCFGALAVAVAGADRSSRPSTIMSLVGASTVALVGALTLAEYIGHLDLGIDQLLFVDPMTTSRPFNGRMSPASAAGFVGAGMSLGFVGGGRTARIVSIGHALAGIPAAVGFLSIAGYAYGVDKLYNFGPFVSVALHTGVGFLIVAAAIALTRSEDGWAHPFVDSPVGRRALLQIAALALLVPFITGLLVVRGIRAGYYQAGFTPALFAVAAAAALMWVAFRAARILATGEAALRATRRAMLGKERELEHSNERHRALLEGLPQMVWTTTPDGAADYFSPQWVRYTGIAEELQLGGAWLERVVHPDDRARTLECWRGAVAGTHEYDVDYRIRSGSGAYRWFKARGIPLVGDDGRIRFWFGTCTDIEDIVAAREVLTRSRGDLEAQVASRTSELMAVEAQLRQSQKMEAVGQLTGGVAHDFNNLLTIIRSASDLLRRPGLAEDRRRRYLDAITDTADRAAKLTGQLLAFSRRQALKPEIFDASERVGSIVDMLRSLVGARVTVVFEPDGEPCFMEADASQFETALVNMAVNARDAMPEGGVLTIAIEAAVEIPPRQGHAQVRGRFVAVSIRDKGVGIAPNRIEQIFEPFFTTKEVGKGTGLGLSQVFGFAKQSRGDIIVASEEGKGSTFTLYLPHAERAAAPAAPGGIVERPGLVEEGLGRHILVVEDNEQVATFSTQLLQDLGYRTTWCGTAAEALDALAAGSRFDLIFSDIVMPGMSGVELGHEVRRRYPSLPVVLTSGYSDVLVDEGRNAFELLSKPYAAEELSRILRRAVGRSSTPSPERVAESRDRMIETGTRSS